MLSGELAPAGESLGWVELYKVHEIIRDGIKPKKLPELGWATKADDSAFTRAIPAKHQRTLSYWPRVAHS